MDNKELSIEQTKKDGVLFCKLTGWLDPNTSPKLLDEVNLKDVKELVFDMTEVEYVFSAGLRAMLMFQRALEENGGKIKLVNVPDSVRFVFEDTGLEEMLENK